MEKTAPLKVHTLRHALMTVLIIYGYNNMLKLSLISTWSQFLIDVWVSAYRRGVAIARTAFPCVNLIDSPVI